MIPEDASPRVPVRAADWEERPDGSVTVRRPKFGPVGRSVARVVGLETKLEVHLDPLGSDVWRLLDGERTVQDVLRSLQERHPEEEALAPRLGHHLSVLASNRLIRMEGAPRRRGNRPRA